MSATITVSGPVFDGRADEQVRLASDEIAKRVATIGASIIRSEQHRVYRIETPFDRLQNVATPDPPGWKIWDMNLIYGPWLEGVGSRNRTTRFKGYATYRRKYQEIDRRAGVIADYTMREYIPGMNA